MTESAGTLVTLKFSIICASFIWINGIILLIKHTVMDEINKINVQYKKKKPRVKYCPRFTVEKILIQNE